MLEDDEVAPYTAIKTPPLSEKMKKSENIFQNVVILASFTPTPLPTLHQPTATSDEIDFDCAKRRSHIF